MTSAVLNILLGLAVGPDALGSAFRASHARDLKDPFMLYPLLIAPFVSASALWLFFQFFSPRGVSGSVSGGAALGFSLWTLGAGHGIVIDFATYALDPLVVVFTLIVTFSQGALSGAILSRWV